MSKPYLFTADLHLGSGSREEEARKEAAFLSLLDRASDSASGLAILGDLFDFWFEYRHAIPKRALRIVARIAELHDAGLPVTFVGGNHDVWLAAFLGREFGVPSHAGRTSLAVGGRRILVTHGDEMVAGSDPGYRLLKRLLRNPVTPRLFRLLHPDIGIPFGRLLSGLSRDYRREDGFFLGETLRAAIERAFDGGHDAVVMGHLHIAEHVRLPRGECLVLGGWTGRLSVVSLSDGVFAHEQWPREADSDPTGAVPPRGAQGESESETRCASPSGSSENGTNA